MKVKQLFHSDNKKEGKKSNIVSSDEHYYCVDRLNTFWSFHKNVVVEKKIDNCDKNRHMYKNTHWNTHIFTSLIYKCLHHLYKCLITMNVIHTVIDHIVMDYIDKIEYLYCDFNCFQIKFERLKFSRWQLFILSYIRFFYFIQTDSIGSSQWRRADK